MNEAVTEVPEFTTEDARASFARHLRAANKSPRTIQSYLEALDQFNRFLAEQGMPRSVTGIRREHVESWIVALQEGKGRKGPLYRPSSVANRFRSLRVFFNWLVREDEIPRSPMEKMPAPFVPPLDVPILPPAEVQALLGTVSGTTFDDRRDLAILRVLIDCGLRRNEAASLRVQDVDLDRRQLWVDEGKGRRGRWVALHDKTVRALDRYERLRPRHAYRGEESYWLGKRGPMGDSGILQVIRRRGRQAGITIHPHMLRHLAVSNDLSEGMQEMDAMHKFGWKSREMLSRYASATSADRALEATRRLRGGDRY